MNQRYYVTPVNTEYTCKSCGYICRDDATTWVGAKAGKIMEVVYVDDFGYVYVCPHCGGKMGNKDEQAIQAAIH